MRLWRLSLLSIVALATNGAVGCGGSADTDIGKEPTSGPTVGAGGSSGGAGGAGGAGPITTSSATTTTGGSNTGSTSVGQGGQSGGNVDASVEGAAGSLGRGAGGSSAEDAGAIEASDSGVAADGSAASEAGNAASSGSGGSTGQAGSGSAGQGGAFGGGGSAGEGGGPASGGAAGAVADAGSDASGGPSGTTGSGGSTGTDAAQDAAAVTHQLTTTISGGTGKIVLSPVGTSCGANCTSYVEGASVLLYVTPAPGYLFINWSGDCSGSNTATGVTLTSDKSCVANIVPILNVSVSGKGGGTVSDSLGGISDCASQCTEPVSPGTEVVLSAKTTAGYSFTGWSGDCTGTSSDVSVTMDGPKSCTASFSPLSYVLSVGVANGTGGVVYYGANNGCATTCTRGVSYGDGLKLSAQPYQGYTFQGWSGDCSGQQRDVALMVQGNIDCTATFVFGSDSGVPADAVADSVGQCNSIANDGQVVTMMNVPADLPTYIGGPLFPGSTYALTAATVYTGPGGATGPEGTTFKETVVYDGSPVSGLAQGVISVDGAANESFNAMLSRLEATTLFAEPTCGPLPPKKYVYTSTLLELRIYDDELGAEFVLTRR